MKEFCLSTVVYPSAEKYFDDFLSGVQSISEIADTSVVVIAQGDVELPEFDKAINLTVFNIGNDASIADVRAFMFEMLKTLPEHQCYIFSDIDDRLHPESFKHHKDALSAADFSYGDIRLYHEDLKTPYNKNLFELSDVPAQLSDLSDMLHGHFTGLSAMAMNRRAIDSLPKRFPNDIVFVDYWLVCSLLSAGLKGARAGEVLDYRLSKSSYDALKASDDIDVLEKRTNEVIKILDHFKSNTDISRTLEGLNNLRHRLQNDPQSVLFAAKKIVPEWGLWCQDVFLLTDYFRKENVS